MQWYIEASRTPMSDAHHAERLAQDVKLQQAGKLLSRRSKLASSKMGWTCLPSAK